MNGAATPSSGLEGDIPNYYPWLFNALVAWVSHLSPGGRAYHGQGPLLLVQLAGSALTLLAIGRQLAGVAGGAAAVLFGTLSGGLGWLRAPGADLVFDPRAEGGQEATRYLGDLLSSLWQIPLVVNYVRIGGFVNTASPPVALGPLSILGGWGIVTPFALLGLAWTRGQRELPMVKAITTLLVVGVGFVMLCWLFPRFGGAGFTTLGRPHRYWPLVHIGIVLFAALGASRLLAIVSQRSRYAAVAVGALTVDNRCSCDPIFPARKRCVQSQYPARFGPFLVTYGAEEHPLQSAGPLDGRSMHGGGPLLAQPAGLRLLGLPVCPVPAGSGKPDSTTRTLSQLLR